MRIAKFERYDMLNNPGSNGPAFTIWFSGCTAKCPGCHNQVLWDESVGKYHTVRDILDMIIDAKMSDNHHLTLTRKYNDVVLLGGEPMEQDEAEIIDLVGILSYLGIRIWLYTGWEITDITKSIKTHCYFIKTGRYMEELKCTGFPASRNQKVFIRDENNRLKRRK